MPAESSVKLNGAALELGGRRLWSNLDLDISPGEFIAVLGPNGSGKTSFINVLLGQLQLSEGTVSVLGQEAGESNSQIGYIPQQKTFDRFLPIRGRDLVELGLNGNHYGLWHNHAAAAKLVDGAITRVKASRYANKPIGLLSGGEQQRLRVAQAIVGSPQLLLCDEPLLSLDLASQKTITALLNNYRKDDQAAIIFVTHEINPILPWVDKVLYIANGKWVLDKPDEVLRSKTLSDLYDTDIEVINLNGRLIVVGADASAETTGGHHEGHA